MIIRLVLGALLGASITAADTLIVTGVGIGTPERNAALTLADDLRERVPTAEVRVTSAGDLVDWTRFDHVMIVGTVASQPWFTSPEAIRQGVEVSSLAAEAFVVKALTQESESPRLVVIVGGDVRGVHYAVSHVATKLLAIDPLAFWTGRETVPQSQLVLPDYHHRSAAPVYKLRGYFDNDNDMLANFSGRKLVVEIELWREMIDSLVRLGYNYIDPHDALGRPEYYLREYYTAMTDYETDLELVEQIIDYAHLKGMLVQIPMYLGWEFRHITFDEVGLSEHHDRWMEVYDYYLNESPLGKGDLFLARPRHPIYDWAYQSPAEAEAGIDPGPLLTRMFNELRHRVLARNPDARVVCDLWMEGLPMWKDGSFAPDKSVMMMWADHGFADFPEGWPTEFDGHDFGVYLHAGVWKNQVVQDPYPHRIRDVLREGARRGLTHNLLVNGQNFKGFLLNLEAAGRAAWDPEDFDPGAFYLEWSARYFGERAAPQVVQALEQLHEAHERINGFRDVMKDSQRILRRFRQEGREPRDPEPVETALRRAETALALADLAGADVSDDALITFEDQVRYPIRIFVQNLRFNLALTRLSNATLPDHVGAPKREGLGRDCTRELGRLRTMLEAGSGWDKWTGWYAPENFRIHTPPPTLADLKPLLQLSER